MQTLIFILSMIAFQNVAYPQASAHSIQRITGDVSGSLSNPDQKCMIDICGTPTQANTFMAKYFDRRRHFMRLLENPKQIDYPPAVAKLFAEIQKNNVALSKGTVARFRQSAPLGTAVPGGLSKAMYNIIWLTPYLKKIRYKANVVNGVTEVGIDEQATLNELKDVASDDRKWVLQVAKYFVSAHKSASVSEGEIQTQPVQLLLRQRYPDLSLRAAMKHELEKAQAKVKELDDLSPLEKSIFFNNTTPNRIALIASRVADGSVNETESREILRWNVESARSELYYRDPKSPLLTRDPPPIEEIIKKSGGPEAIAQAYENDRVVDQKNDESKVQACKMRYFLNKSLLPSKAQVEALKRDVERGKKLVTKMIESKFPESVRAKLIAVVERAEFIMPPSVADFEKSFESSLRQKASSGAEDLKVMVGVSDTEIRQLVSVFSMAKRMESPKDLKSSSNSFCDAFEYSPMSDANYTTYGSIILSYTTATGEETTRMKSVMHELGHSVSRAISDDPAMAERFIGVKRCLSGQHTEDYPPRTKKQYEEMKMKNPKAEAPYVEEDFADVIAGESGRGLKGKNAWCQLLSPTADLQSFAESKMQSEDGDPHSSSLFRLLNFEMINKGRLPHSCEEFLAASRNKPNFSQCFDFVSPTQRPNHPGRTVK